MNASERRNARKLARRRTRELVAIRRAFAVAESSRGLASPAGRASVGGVPQPRGAES